MSYVVHTIDHDCAVVPYPSQKSTLTGQLLPNVGYEGQKPEEIADLGSYRHLRDSSEEKKLRIFGNPQ